MEISVYSNGKSMTRKQQVRESVYYGSDGPDYYLSVDIGKVQVYED